jgi:hypothetical protein
MKPGGMHWGALVFTGLLAAASLLVFGRFLTAPFPTLVSEGDEPSEPSPTLDMRTPLAPELHSHWYTQSAVDPIAVGESADVTVQFVNTGHVAWIRGTPSEIRLGEIGDTPLPLAMKVDWPLPDRPAIQTESIVYEDQTATFTFRIAGTAPGTYRVRVRPVVDGVAWLEDDGVYVDIVVR